MRVVVRFRGSENRGTASASCPVDASVRALATRIGGRRRWNCVTHPPPLGESDGSSIVVPVRTNTDRRGEDVIDPKSGPRDYVQLSTTSSPRDPYWYEGNDDWLGSVTFAERPVRYRSPSPTPDPIRLPRRVPEASTDTTRRLFRIFRSSEAYDDSHVVSRFGYEDQEPGDGDIGISSETIRRTSRAKLMRCCLPPSVELPPFARVGRWVTTGSVDRNICTTSRRTAPRSGASPDRRVPDRRAYARTQSPQYRAGRDVPSPRVNATGEAAGTQQRARAGETPMFASSYGSARRPRPRLRQQPGHHDDQRDMTWSSALAPGMYLALTASSPRTRRRSAPQSMRFIEVARASSRWWTREPSLVLIDSRRRPSRTRRFSSRRGRRTRSVGASRRRKRV